MTIRLMVNSVVGHQDYEFIAEDNDNETIVHILNAQTTRGAK